jgi:tetratricopeptide (TPR) repeat protein
MGGFEPWVITLALGAIASNGCSRAPDYAAACRHALEAKSDALDACTSAYVENASVTNAKQLVNVYITRGDQAVTTLLAFHPIDPIGAEIWHKRGGQYRDAGDTDHSIPAYERALALRGDNLEGQIRELAALSERYESKDDVRHALAIQARAFATATRLGDPIVLAHVRVALATELSLVGDEAGAERVFGDSVDRLPPDDSYLPYALLTIGDNHRYHGRLQLAKVTFERVLALTDEQAIASARYSLIEVAFARSDLAEAKKLIEADADKTTSGHMANVARLALAEGRLEDALPASEAAVAASDHDHHWLNEAIEGEVLAKIGREPEAIEVLDKAITEVETGLDQLGIDELKAWTQGDLDHRVPYEHLFVIHARAGRAMEALAVAQRATARAYLDGLVATPQPPSQDVASLARSAGVRADALHVIARSLRASGSSRTPDTRALSQALANSIVWTYFAADGYLWLVAVDHGVATVDNLGSAAAIADTLALAAALNEDALAKLDRWLAPPRRWSRVDSTSVIHIVAGAPFDRIPFAALGRGDDRWIHRAALAYVPSAAVLIELARRSSNGGELVVLGDPTNDLPGARGEAVATAEYFHIAARIGEVARARDVIEAGRAALLNISSHADVTPGGASLRLADGVVTVADILDHALAPRLVVLASCASGATNVDAWGALAGAFIAAGAPNVIASRWSIDDLPTRELLAQFYQSDGLHHPALALAIAQRAAIAHQVPVSAWASLVALGTGENIEPGGSR